MCVSATPMAPGDARLWSRYGPRMGFTSRRPQFHAGTDFGAPIGTSVYAPRAGVVQNLAHEESGLRGNPFSGYGNAVVLFHADENLWTLYAHLDEIAVEIGQTLQPGELLGRSGKKNNGKFPAMPPHLHMEVRHAKHDGSSPFPGAYRTFNQDPLAWLVTHGINIGRSGFIYDSALDACPSPVPQLIATRGMQLGTALPPSTSRRPQLIGLGQVTGDEHDSDFYEPSLTEDSDLISLPWGPLFGIGVLSIGLVGLHYALK